MTDLVRIFVDVSRYHQIITHNAVSKLGVGRGMAPVLGYISHNDGCRQSDISRHSHCTPATATVMLQSMEKNGFIKRVGDENDQRCMRIYITDSGREIARLGKEIVDRSDEEFFSVLNKEEQTVLREILLKLRQGVEESIEKGRKEKTE